MPALTTIKDRRYVRLVITIVGETHAVAVALRDLQITADAHKVVKRCKVKDKV